MAALQMKNIPTGAGDDIKFDISYSKGDIKNVIVHQRSGAPSFAMFGGSGFRARTRASASVRARMLSICRWRLAAQATSS